MRIVKCFWPAFLWAILILIACGLPGDDFSNSKLLLIPYFDKFVHFSFYFGLNFLLILGFEWYHAKHIGRIYVSSLIVCVLYGGLIEIMQDTIFIHRSADWFDFLANSIGAIAGLLVYLISRTLIIRIFKINKTV